ncbi:programmed cell death protein 2 [Lipomyces japonicus]|uniref:programmed cell death protein 2 n=1 Tax=Lipomyces japonicus TaxID=56871 RepID=UPI0034CDEDE3
MSGNNEAYESDSESDVSMSDSAVGRTSVLLGYPDEPVDNKVTAYDTRIGGKPVWLNKGSLPDARLAKCNSCSSLMTLLLQAYAALEGTLYERIIYVYGCKSAQCRRKPGSIRAFRGVLRDEEKMKSVAEKERQKKADQQQQADQTKAAAQQANLGNVLFGGNSSINPFGANPFGSGNQTSSSPLFGEIPKSSNSDSEVKIDAVTEALEKSTINTNSKISSEPFLPWPESADQSPYQSYYLFVENEYLSDKVGQDINQNVQILPESSSSDGGRDDWSALPESSNSLDKTFQKFADIAAENPEQVVRYDRAGSPLFYSKTDEVATKLTQQNTGVYSSRLIPSCELCGSFRVFELQLMPNAIQVLEEGSGLDLIEGMEWGTIIVCTCEKDCVPLVVDSNNVGYTEEWVGVQWEENAK